MRSYKPWPDYVSELKSIGEWPFDNPARREEISREWKRDADSFFEQQERPVLVDLASAGIDVKSVWDIVNSKTSCPDALPVLFDHLGKKHHPKVLEGIARAMAIPQARQYWDGLRSYYLLETDHGVREALALALANSVDDEHKGHLIDLFRDEGNGANRTFFMHKLAEADDAETWLEIEAAQSDPIVGQGARELVAKRARRKQRR